MSKANLLKASGLTLAVVAGSALAVTAANAHQGGGSEEDRAARTAELAERFDLDESELQAYFDEKKAERQAEREEMRAEHISSLVEAGTLTQEQADALTALKDGFKEEIEALRGSDAESSDIKAAMQENRAEVEAWADAEGIDLDDIKPERGQGREGHRGPHGPNGDDEAEDSDEA